MRKFFLSILEVVEIGLVALGTVFLVRTFLVQPFLVSGDSMVPNFSNGDYLLVDELVYRFRNPARGEVVVFHYPNDESTYFIKRIIGLPGEVVRIKDGKITIFSGDNAREVVLEENYISYNSRRMSDGEFKLEKDEYFVLGDNRSYSFDSRNWGALKRDKIVGMVRLRLWPPQSLRIFAAPQY